nr:hypothetical protein [Veillonella tobetsuensis]
MGLSYWAMSMVNNDVKSVKVDPEQHTLMVISNDAVISKRILGMKQIGDDVYFLGYEGYGIYNVKENTIRLNAIQFKGNHIEPGQLKNYHKGVRHVETVANFQDFSADEQRNFSDLLNATDKGAHYIKPYYQSGYESSLIDLDKKFFITNNVKSLKQGDSKLYILDGSGFIIIDRSKQEIQGYFNTRILGEGTKGVPDSLKGHYGSQFIRIYALNKIEPDDLSILWNLRKQYLEKNKIDVQEQNLFPLELIDVHQ